MMCYLSDNEACVYHMMSKCYYKTTLVVSIHNHQLVKQNMHQQRGLSGQHKEENDTRCGRKL